jgi:hypothetical protein
VAVPACSSCGSCGSCAPCGSCASCQYMPGVVYRALYRPAVVAAYQPLPACNTCGGGSGSCYAPCAASYAPCASCAAAYPVTTYRPLLGTYETRLVPYTTYRPVYTPVVSYGCVGYSPCASCSPCGGYGPAVGCSSCAAGGCSSCAGGGCGAAMYGAPQPGCASCGLPPASPPVVYSLAPVASPPVSYGSAPAGSPPVLYSTPPGPGASTPKTFQNETEKPPAGSDLKPIPDGGVRPNSLPAPALPDPNNGRVARAAPVRPLVRVQPAALAVPAGAEDDGWRPARK